MAKNDVTALRAARGVVFVHAAPKAACPHFEWAVSRVLGEPVNFEWAPQPAERGAMRTDFAWEGAPGSGAAIAAAIAGWEAFRVEVTELSQDGPGQRWMYTPALGMHHAQTDAVGNLVVTEDRIRAVLDEAHLDALAIHQGLRAALGEAWDDELEPYRMAQDVAPVVWLHQVG